MPPHTFSSSARLLYLFTALVMASIVATVQFAGAGQEEAQCKGNSPKKVCPIVSPVDGATVSGTVTVSAQADEPVASIAFAVDDAALAAPETAPPYEAKWDTSKSSNGTHVLKVTTLDAAGKSSVLEHQVDVSNDTAPPPPPSGDTTAPTVGLTSPASGATVSGAVTVAASASDNVAVVGVQFKIDGGNLGSEDTTAPYSVSWSTPNVSNGDHTITAVARDAAGNSADSQRSVSVSNTTTTPPPPSGDTTAPTVGLTSPASGATVSGAVTVAASASDNVAVVGVQFKIDGGNLGSEDTTAPYSVSWSTPNVSNGDHTITAVARDAAGNSADSQRSVSVSNTTTTPPPPSGDTTAPTVGLTSPASGATVSGAVTVAASASDNVAVVGVQFKIDGGNLGSEDTTAPYSVSWSTPNVSNGGHNVTAVARDAAGNTSASQRSVTVSNSSGGSTGPSLAWVPPALSNAVTINVTNANRRLFLDNSRDYRLNITETLHKELWIEGGRNVVVIGGHITIDQLGSDNSYQDNTAVKVRFGDPAGTVHLEGLLIDGPYVADGIGVATGRNVQIENVRVEHVSEIERGPPRLRPDPAGSGQSASRSLHVQDGAPGHIPRRPRRGDPECRSPSRQHVWDPGQVHVLPDEPHVSGRAERILARDRVRLYGVGVLRLLGVSAGERSDVGRQVRSDEAIIGLVGRNMAHVRRNDQHDHRPDQQGRSLRWRFRAQLIRRKRLRLARILIEQRRRPTHGRRRVYFPVIGASMTR